MEFFWIRDGIVAALRKRAAAPQASHGQAQAAARAMALDGCGRVMRSRRIELAGGNHDRGEHHLIEADAEEQQSGDNAAYRGSSVAADGVGCGTLRSKITSSLCRVAKLLPATERRGCITKSHPDGISNKFRLRISRMRRRIRLRTTAPPSAFFTLMPKRLRSAPLAQ